MENNPVSLTRINLNISTPGDQGITLNRGELLRGVVQEVRADGLVMLLLKGQLVEAASEVLVKAGQQLFLMVDDIRDGRTYLKALTPENMQKIENSHLAASLNQMGVAAREENVVMARKLLQHNLPATPGNLQEMARGCQLLGEINPRNLELTGFLLARGIPLGREVLLAFSQLVEGGLRLDQLLAQLQAAVDRLSPQPSGGSPALTSALAANPGGQPLPSEQTSVQLQGTPVTFPAGQEEAGKTPVGPPSALTTPGAGDPQGLSGPNAESAARQSIAGGMEQQGGAQLSGGSGEGAARGAAMPAAALDLLRDLLALLRIAVDDPASPPGDKLARLLSQEGNLLRGLMLVDDLLREAEGSLRNTSVAETLSRLETLTRELTGQKLFNFITRSNPDTPLNYYYLSFPVQVGEQYHLCQLRVDRESGKKSLHQQDQIRFIVSLATERMGIVLFHVTWQRNQTLTLQGVAESEEVSRYLQTHLGTLAGNLEKLGYQVNSLGIKVAQAREELEDLRVRLTEQQQAVRPLGIDIRV